jgi:PmbA protein
MKRRTDSISGDWGVLAQKVLKRAKELGMEAELRCSQGQRLSVRVRNGATEAIRQSTPSSAALRLFKDKRSISGSTAPLDLDRVLTLMDRMAQDITLLSADDHSGLPDAQWLYKEGDLSLSLYDPSVEGLSVEECAEAAAKSEKAALAADPRIKNFDEASMGTDISIRGIYNTSGLAAVEIGSYVSLDCSPVAEDEAGNKFADGWFTHSRRLEALDSPENVGKEATNRTVAMIGAKSAPTGKFPVIFTPHVARGLLGHLFEVMSGTNIYKKASYLAGKQGEQVASTLVTVVDDPHMPRGLQSTLFDAEGVATTKRVLVESGKWSVVPTDAYSARKLGLPCTGNGAGGAVRGYNLHIANGASTREEMLSTMGTGLLVTSFIGFGFNQATGDFSRGARGYWIEGGKIAYPVHEITVSGNLDEMMKAVKMVGNDLEHRYGTDSPSLLIEGVTVSGSSK